MLGIVAKLPNRLANEFPVVVLGIVLVLELATLSLSFLSSLCSLGNLCGLCCLHNLCSLLLLQ